MQPGAVAAKSDQERQRYVVVVPHHGQHLTAVKQ
jgi:hypothetical protein